MDNKDKSLISIFVVISFVYLLMHLNERNKRKSKSKHSSQEEEIKKESTYVKNLKNIKPSEDKEKSKKPVLTDNGINIYSSQDENIMYSNFDEDDIFIKTAMNTPQNYKKVNFDIMKLSKEDVNVKNTTSTLFNDYDYDNVRKNSWVN